MHVRVGLDGHERVDVHGAELAHAAEVVAAEVDEHHVLGALLLVGQQLLGDRLVVVDRRAARAGAGDRPRRDVAAGDRDQRLGRGADDLEVLEVEEVHVRRRVDGAQAAVDRERLDRHLGRPALAGHDLERVAGVDVLDDAGDVRLELLARHVGLELRLRAGLRGRVRERAGEPLADLADPLTRVLALVAVREDRDGVLEVVERHDDVGQHQRHVGESDRVGVDVGKPLDGAHAVVAEEAHRAARERDRLLDRRLPVLRDLGRRDRVRVAAVGQRPAQHLARLVADERPAADALALLGRLEQEGGAGAAQLQEGADRGLAVLDEGLADRDEVVRGLSDAGQAGPPRRRRG